MSWANQTDSSFLGSMTGILSWMGLRSSLAAVVMIVKGGVILGHGVSKARINVRLGGQDKCHQLNLPC